MTAPEPAPEPVQASTRSGLRSPECRSGRVRHRPHDLRFNEVRAAKPGVSRISPITACWHRSLQRGPGCEARSVTARRSGNERDERRFNEVRAAKPGVSVHMRQRQRHQPSASTRSGLRSPECRRQCAAQRHVDQRASTRSGLRSPECQLCRRGGERGARGASTRSGLRSPECPGANCVVAPAPLGASTRSGLRSPECPARKRRHRLRRQLLQRGPGCEARSVHGHQFAADPLHHHASTRSGLRSPECHWRPGTRP